MPNQCDHWRLWNLEKDNTNDGRSKRTISAKAIAKGANDYSMLATTIDEESVNGGATTPGMPATEKRVMDLWNDEMNKESEQQIKDMESAH